MKIVVRRRDARSHSRAPDWMRPWSGMGAFIPCFPLLQRKKIFIGTWFGKQGRSRMVQEAGDQWVIGAWEVMSQSTLLIYSIVQANHATVGMKFKLCC